MYVNNCISATSAPKDDYIFNRFSLLFRFHVFSLKVGAFFERYISAYAHFFYQQLGCSNEPFSNGESLKVE